MKRIQLLSIVGLWLLVACNRSSMGLVPATFDITVQGLGSDCKLPLLNFGTRTAEVAQLTGQPSTYQLYTAINLDPMYWKAGTTLQVTIRKATVHENPVCTTMGPAYPGITVVSAAAK